MTEELLVATDRPARRLGGCGEQEGPLVIAIGGLHGNEPSGVRAIQRVYATLSGSDLPVHGRFVGFRGNIPALLAGKRFLDRDLNRTWNDEVFNGEDSDDNDSESREQRDLLNAIEEEIRQHRARFGEEHEIVLLDLHSTSTGDAPFVVVSDTLRNRRLALKLELPIVLGLEERVQGTLLEYMTSRGYIALCIEGGQHGVETSTDNHEAALWLALVSLGVISSSASPRYRAYPDRLRKAGRGCPRITEITYLYSIEPKEQFRMQPGFRNFERIDTATILATSGHQEIFAPHNGRILMPLYQRLGTDGFFLVRKVGYGWLVLSSIVRRLGLEPCLSWLPAVKKHSDGHIVIDLRIARFFVPQIFHLFGYRLTEETPERAVFRRRCER